MSQQMFPSEEVRLPFRKLPTCLHVDAFLKFVNDIGDKHDPRREFMYIIDDSDFITIRSSRFAIASIKEEFERIKTLKVVKCQVDL